MGRWVVLGKIVGGICFAGGPIDIELFLCDAIFKPVVAHVECFGSFHANLSSENANGGRIVGFERCPG